MAAPASIPAFVALQLRAGGPCGPGCPPPACPVCGRVAQAWYSVPLCQPCRAGLVGLSAATRGSFLLARWLARPAPAAGFVQGALWEEDGTIS